MGRKVSLILAAAAVLGMSGCATQTVNHPSGTELPVSRVVLYQSGIGYVERTATVTGDELILRIRPDQINDILKSLTVIDRSKGRPVSISLPVDRDTLDSLAQIPDQIKEGGIRSLLVAFRGANVKIKARSKSHSGRIVGVDGPANNQELKISVNSDDPEHAGTVTLLTPNDVLEVIAISDIRSVELFDKSLANGLEKSLNISLNEGDWKQLELRVRMDDTKKRELAMSYLVAMPTWKPAYRLVLADDKKGTLQGWAVISNVTGADWNNINFSLVSGQPMSFTYDLYTPQFLTRPDLSGLAAQKATAPEIIESGYRFSSSGAGGGGAGSGVALQRVAMAESAKAAPGRANTKSAKSKRADGRALGSRAMEDKWTWDAEEEYDSYDDYAQEDEEVPVISSNEMVDSFTQLAEKAQIGSFDEYKLASKLTVPDGSTALVNLIQSELDARDTRLIRADNIYSFDNFYKGWKNNKSFQTIELSNKAGVALDSGPITIYRDSAIIGEGYLSRTENDSTAYITFANESRLSVSVKDTIRENDLRLDSVRNGRCSFTTEESLTQKMSFESQIANQTVALLQLKRYADWEPVNFPENVVKTADRYVISVDVPGKDSVELPLTMKRDLSKSTNLTSTRSSDASNNADCARAMKNALDKNAIPAEQAELFRQYVQDVEAMDQLKAKISSLETRRDEIQKDQSMLTQNLAGLKDIKTSSADALRNQLMSRQKSNEKALDDITTQLYGLRVNKSEMELRMQTNVKTMNYTRQ